MSFSKAMNMATGQLDRKLYEAHTSWLKAGGKGAGRLEIKGEIMRRMSAAALKLDGARFEGCDFRGADFMGLRISDCTFVDCKFGGARGQPELGD